MPKITKAIIPAAGLGTRFLPQTKAMPKEMLPIVDKPIIQLVVEELVEVGVTDIIIVTGAHKRAIEDHFDRSIELEQTLIGKGKDDLAIQAKEIAELANFVYVRQKGEPSGNARPVLNAAHLLGDEAFFVLFPDDFFVSTGVSRARQLLDAYQQHQAPVLSLVQVEREDTSRYGIIKPAEQLDDVTFSIEQLLEKPGPDKAPSTIASVGGYIMTADTMPFIEALTPGAGGEIVLADALMAYAKDNQVVGRVIDGTYFDGGSKLSYLKAVISAGLADPKFADELKEHISELL